MKKALRVSAAVCLLVAGCANTPHPGATSPHAATDTPAARTAKAIDAILYTNATREQLLAELKPYVSPMESKAEVEGKLALQYCVGSGPGVHQCQVSDSGLSLVFDPDQKLRVIRRSARVVAGIEYPEMSLTDRGFEWNGYRRWYQN
jgi:hypothetical protein